ncbi:hypothetical protein [Pseudomonas gessardii]|uniref:hypothetical protein n=1 Tax=Pseudomonas gessardii TaxID=78544 RepID=UPI0014732808|nr:hypothetical protein [Pseudomonas gessardii]NNA66419.1 hypothetical protein [Pseudomonas gessardii]
MTLKLLLSWGMKDGRLQPNMNALNGRNALFRKKADRVLFSFNLLGYLDRSISGTTWLAAYREGIAAGKKSTVAALDSDKAVRQSQGGTGTMGITADRARQCAC